MVHFHQQGFYGVFVLTDPLLLPDDFAQGTAGYTKPFCSTADAAPLINVQLLDFCHNIFAIVKI